MPKTKAAPKPPAKSPKSASVTRRGRPPAYDWKAILRMYRRGDDSVTLESLSRESRGSGWPSLAQLKRRSSEQDWPDLRAEFRYQDATRAQQLDLETIEDVRHRHVRSAKILQTIGLKGFAAINARAQELSPFEASRIYQLGIETERKARGMEEFTVRIEDLRSPEDLKKLTTDQLLELRARVKANAKA